MLDNILIGVGIFFFILGVFGLVAAFFSPIMSAFRVVFKRDDDDLKYNSERGQEFLQKEYAIIKKTCILSIIVGLVIMVIGMFIKFSTQGYDSLFSSVAEGGGVGDNLTPSDLKEKRDTFYYGGVSENSVGGICYNITISGMVI